MNYRYPGPQSFTEEDELLFFGRKRETKALHDLILVQPLVVLFAKSGMGKTSLLQAGIIPRLRFTEYDPIILRLNDVKISPEQQALRKIASDTAPDSNLWAEIIRYNKERDSVPLLIFDQFEEIFTLYSEEQRAAFVGQLADVINGTLPNSIRQHIRKEITSSAIETSEIEDLERIPEVKIVLSIRSDLLHFLHLLSPEIPSILRNRFELLGLRPDQAKEAITYPAAQAQEVGDYASQSFTFSDTALTQIIQYLSRQRKSAYSDSSQEAQVESFQLQLLCEFIERKVIAEYPKPSVNPLLINEEFYGGEAGIEQILSQFYANTLKAISDPRQVAKTRRLLEDHLMKNERRVSVDQTTITETHGVKSENLELLVNKRLLRQDTRETGEYFEISHDTLLGPILKSKLGWESKKAAKRVRELIAWIFTLFVLAAGALVFCIWAFGQKDEAQRQAKIAEDKTRIANEETAKAKAAQLRSDSLLDQVLEEQGKTRVALEDARQKELARQQEAAAKNKLKFADIFKEAETLFKAKKYYLAKQKYKEALNLAPNDKKQEVQTRINQCNQ